MSPKMPANVFRRLRIVSSASSASRRPTTSFTSFTAVTGWVELATPAADAAADGADGADSGGGGAGVADVVLHAINQSWIMLIRAAHFKHSSLSVDVDVCIWLCPQLWGLISRKLGEIASCFPFGVYRKVPKQGESNGHACDWWRHVTRWRHSGDVITFKMPLLHFLSELDDILAQVSPMLF